MTTGTAYETVSTWEVFTETGGHWELCDTEEEAMNAANRLSAKHKRPYLVRRQDNLLHDPIEVIAEPEVPPQGSLFT